MVTVVSGSNMITVRLIIKLSVNKLSSYASIEQCLISNTVDSAWLISACAYSGKRNDSMRLIKDMRLYGT